MKSSVTPITDTNMLVPADAIKTPQKGDFYEELSEQISTKTKKYVPPEAEDAEFDTTEKIGWWKMVKREMSTVDYIQFVVGAIASLGVGAALPAFCMYFGKMIDGVADTGAANGDDEQFNSLQK